MRYFKSYFVIIICSVLLGCVDQKSYDEVREAYSEEYQKNLKLEIELTKSKRQYEDMQVVISDEHSNRLTWYMYCRWLTETLKLKRFLDIYGGVSDLSYVSAVGLYLEIKNETRQSDQFKREVDKLGIGHNSTDLLILQCLTALFFGSFLFVPTISFWLVIKSIKYSKFKSKCESMNENYENSKYKLEELNEMISEEESLNKNISKLRGRLASAEEDYIDKITRINLLDKEMKSIVGGIKSLKSQRKELEDKCESLNIKVSIGDDDVF
jgi:predicted nuclease with TOPRIM domain